MNTISTTNVGTRILGIPKAIFEIAEDVCLESVNQEQTYLTSCDIWIMSLGAMLLLRLCHIPKINHLACSVVPDRIRPSTDLHEF